MLDVPESPEERQRKRRVRRWKRRGRIAGPFLGIPLLLLTLSLSVDLVEYQPHEKKDRLADQPIRFASGTTEPASTASPVRPGLLEDIPSPSAIPIEPDTLSGLPVGSDVIDPTGPSPETVPPDLFETPTTLYARPLR